MKKRFDIVGKPRRRVDGRAKVTGQLRYADDLSLPRMLFAKLLRSPHPHARIRSIDTSKAEKLPGVKAVITAKDIVDFPIEKGAVMLGDEMIDEASRKMALVISGKGRAAGMSRGDVWSPPEA